MRRVLCILIAALLLSASLPMGAPQAQPAGGEASYEELDERARQAFEAGQFEEAIRNFELAFEKRPDPNILYNIAFIYDEKLRDQDKAAAFYEKYAAQPEAPAANKEKALRKAAAIRFQQRSYDAALTLFQEAYDITPTPEYLYYIARSHEAQNQYEVAIQFYERTLNEPGDLPAAARADATARIKALREILALNDPTDDGGDGGDDGTPGPVYETDYTLAYVFLGSGGALLLGGTVFGILTASEHSAFEDATTIEARRDAADAGETYGVVADSLWISGGVVAAVGLVFLLTAEPEEVNPDGVGATMIITPQIGAGYNGLGLEMTF